MLYLKRIKLITNIRIFIQNIQIIIPIFLLKLFILGKYFNEEQF